MTPKEFTLDIILVELTPCLLALKPNGCQGNELDETKVF
jgi:hypothetical protein